MDSVAKVFNLCLFNLKPLVRVSIGTTVVVAFLNLEMTMKRYSYFLGFEAWVSLLPFREMELVLPILVKILSAFSSRRKLLCP